MANPFQPQSLCGLRSAERGEGCGLSNFFQVSMMECKLLWVQITLTDSGPPCARLYENRCCYLGNREERLFKRNILSFSLIHCSWRFRTLLLNCSCYGYQHLYQQPFVRLSPCITRASPPTSTSTPPLFKGFCFMAASIISGLQMCSAQLAVQNQITGNVLLKSLFTLQNETLSHMELEFHNIKHRPCLFGLYLNVSQS